MQAPTTLVLNCGSSSLKFAIIDTQNQQSILQGLAQRLGSEQANIEYSTNDEKHTLTPADNTHQGAIACLLELLTQLDLLDSIAGVGHRVVHGGEEFSQSIIITPENLAKLKQLSPLAPLHNPVNILGIEAILELLPELPQVAVFDTAFHQSLPQTAFLYGVPFELYEQHGIRRYGFHGTSFRYVSQQAATLLNKPLEDSYLLIAHLGNGCSACAVKNGKSVDTSMGLTPLEGLLMGTRSGDIDPGLIPFIRDKLELNLDEIMDMLNKQSGLLGLSGSSNDMRTIQIAAKNGDLRAQIAIEVFAFKIARYLGALAISLPRIDALVFTGGIGENDALTRSKVLAHLSILGFQIDHTLNAQNGDQFGKISSTDSVKAMVVATNEELMIAQDTLALTNKA